MLLNIMKLQSKLNITKNVDIEGYDEIDHRSHKILILLINKGRGGEKIGKGLDI